MEHHYINVGVEYIKYITELVDTRSVLGTIISI